MFQLLGVNDQILETYQTYDDAYSELLIRHRDWECIG